MNRVYAISFHFVHCDDVDDIDIDDIDDDEEDGSGQWVSHRRLSENVTMKNRRLVDILGEVEACRSSNEVWNDSCEKTQSMTQWTQ